MDQKTLILRRIKYFFIVSIMIMLVLATRLAYLQIVEGHYYEDVSRENRMRQVEILPPRGEIVSRDGTVLSKNSPGYTVSFMDVLDEDQEHVISYLSDYLDIDREEIDEKIARQQFRQFEPVRLKSDVSYETVAHLEEKRTELPGVVIEVQPVREYPEHELASHLMGYTGEIGRQELESGMQDEGYRAGDIIGKSGLEKSYQEHLKGEPGVRQVEVNRLGRIMNLMGEENPVPGDDLNLTIDLNLQEVLVEGLVDTMENIKEDEEEEFVDDLGGASGVVLNPNTGEILSLVSIPKYNPNTFYENYAELISDSQRPLKNRAITESFPPGSTFKMVTGIAALEEGVYQPGETIIDEGRYWREPHPTNFRRAAHGRIDIVDALAVSSNVFFAEMGYRLGIDDLSQWTRKFGFGKPTGLEDISGEIGGTVAERQLKEERYNQPEDQIWYPGETYIAAIGQGFHAYPPLQLANYASMMANKGTHYRPYLVDSVVDHEGNVITETQPEVINELEVNDRHWEIVREGMQAVSQPGGTAWWNFRDLPFDIGIKTGTAEVYGKNSHSWIVGFAPFDDPEIAFALFIEHGGLSSRVTPPTRMLLNEYFDLVEEEEEEEDIDDMMDEAEEEDLEG